MPFFIESTTVDLGCTSIENIFLNDFMPTADGTYVKVYLLGFKLARDNDPVLEINNLLISKHLNIPLSDVLNAWEFWEKKGIVVRHFKHSSDKKTEDYDVEFKSLVQLYVENNYKVFLKDSNDLNKNFSQFEEKEVVKNTTTIDDVISLTQNKSISNMFNEIDYINRRPLVPMERIRVIDWLKDYNMDPDVIVKAFYIAHEKKGKGNLNYIEGIIRNWYDLKITNSDSLSEYLKRSDEKHYRYELIKKSLGSASTIPTDGERKLIDRWFNEWGFSIDIVLEACNRSINTVNPSINYINGVLSSWYEKNITTLEDVKNEQKAQKKPSISKNNILHKTKFHNFEGRSSKYTSEELDELIKKRQKKI